MKPTAHIENWYEQHGCLFGLISKHERQDDFKAERQMTSRIVARNEDGTVETENTIYTLGEPWQQRAESWLS